jgi:rhomboid protease GluP
MGVIAILVLLGAVWYFTTPQERDRFRRSVLGRVDEVWGGASRYWPARKPFDDALDARTPRPIVTLAIVALNVGIFVSMLFGPGSMADPETIVRWGGSIGPRTANGEWWRLATAMFVQAGLLQLIVNVAGFVQIGLITERFFGRAAFATAYIGAGLLASVLGLLLHPVSVSAGASASVFAIYGMFATFLFAGIAFPSPLRVPPTTIFKIAPGAALFLIYSLASGHAGTIEVAGLAVGLAYGFILAKPAIAETPSVQRVAAITGAVVIIAIAAAVPMRGVTDIRPEIERIAEVEQQTSSTYDGAVRRFANGELSLKELIGVIERTILPELRAAQARLKQLQRVPREQTRLLAEADAYFKLREESWQARVAGLRRTSLKGLRSPDDTERAARQVLEGIRPSETQ